MGFVLILGGARAGKSAYAERLAVESRLPVTFIATAAAGDAEMAARIERHRARRPQEWTTVEEPLDLSGAISAASLDSYVVVDCLTLWVSNLLHEGREADDIHALAEAAARELAGRRSAVVTNEVGLGIVPANELARSFRDVLGRVNAVCAGCAERSVLMVAGRLVELGKA